MRSGAWFSGQDGYEARFAGMTEDQAMRACARLAVRNLACETFGP